MRKTVRQILLRKTVNTAITIVLILVFSFFLFYVIPGDPARMMIPRGGAGSQISPEYLEELRERLGVNDSFPVQLSKFVLNALRFEFGYSFWGKKPVSEVIMDRLPWTLLLVGVSTVFTLLVGIVLGARSAWKRGSVEDTSTLAFGLTFYAMPTFWLGVLLLVLFAYLYPILPSSQPTSVPRPTETLALILDIGEHLILPAATLTLVSLAGVSLVMRNALIDVLTEDYILTARAKGIPEKRVLRRHAMPNAMLPMVTVVALNLGFIIGGAIQVEWVFSYPGLGDLEVRAVFSKDLPVLLALQVLFTFSVVIANFVSDIVYLYMDPRVKYA